MKYMLLAVIPVVVMVVVIPVGAFRGVVETVMHNVVYLVIWQDVPIAVVEL